jgi:hypothetical protein
LKTNLDHAVETHSDRVAACSAEQKRIDSALADLQAALALYRRLGLKFERVNVAGEDLLQLIFTQIDAARPSAEFMFAVHVSDADQYKGARRCLAPFACFHTSTCLRPAAVALCQPPVATDDLVAELNATNNFSRFVQAMRCRFKESL